MKKDKWIHIRCSEEERQKVKELAKANNMTISKFFFWLSDKQEKDEKESQCDSSIT